MIVGRFTENTDGVSFFREVKFKSDSAVYNVCFMLLIRCCCTIKRDLFVLAVFYSNRWIWVN